MLTLFYFIDKKCFHLQLNLVGCKTTSMKYYWTTIKTTDLNKTVANPSGIIII